MWCSEREFKKGRVKHHTNSLKNHTLMSGYINFAVIGAGVIGSYIIAQLLEDKAAGIVEDVIVLSRQV